MRVIADDVQHLDPAGVSAATAPLFTAEPFLCQLQTGPSL